MVRNLEDVLGKNILRDVFRLRGSAETEAEVPPGNAKRIDLWFVPAKDTLAPGAPEFTGILAAMIAEPAAIELWSDPPGVDDFHVSSAKREVWRETLQLRDKRPWPRPMLWHVCAGKPERVLKNFDYVSAEIPGWYRPYTRELRVQVLVISELPKTRSTLLFRLLGRGRVRRDALHELRALPNDAWEKQLALPWLVQLGLEVPVDRLVTPEDKEFVMDIQVWFQDFCEQQKRIGREQAQLEVEARLAEERRLLEALRAEERRQLEALRAEERRQLEALRAEERRDAELKQLVHQFERRVGRRLTGDERDVLAACVKTQGSEYIADLVLDLSGPELAAWLEKNGVARND
jgi:hypothetical protein